MQGEPSPLHENVQGEPSPVHENVQGEPSPVHENVQGEPSPVHGKVGVLGEESWGLGIRCLYLVYGGGACIIQGRRN